MYTYINLFLHYKGIWLALLLTIAAGVFGGFIAASAAFIISLLAIKKKHKSKLLLIGLLITFFMGDNISGSLLFANNFRFVVLAISLTYLSRSNLLKHNSAIYILPFTIVAVIISVLLSQLGYLSILRAISYLLIAVVVFKVVNLLYEKNSTEASTFIIMGLLLYFLITFIFIFIPNITESYIGGRFKGLMGNPNGLGLLLLLTYPLLDLIKYRNETSFSNVFFNVFKILLIVMTILTGSRNALFSLFIYELLIRFNKNYFYRILGVLGIGFSIYFILFVDLFTIISSVGFSDYIRVETLFDASGRTEVWQVAWDEIKISPWLGNGMMYDNYFINDYAERYVNDMARHWGGIWSSYLSFLLNVGIVGILAYAYFVIKVFKKTRIKKLAMAYLVMVLFSAIAESWMAASMNAFTPMFFLYWAIQAVPIKPIYTQQYAKDHSLKTENIVHPKRLTHYYIK